MTQGSVTTSVRGPGTYFARNKWCLFYCYSDASLNESGVAIYVPETGLFKTSNGFITDLATYASNHLMKFGTRASNSQPMPVTFIRAARIYTTWALLPSNDLDELLNCKLYLTLAVQCPLLASSGSPACSSFAFSYEMTSASYSEGG